MWRFILRQRILKQLNAADATGAESLKLAALILLDGLELDRPTTHFTLKATLFEKDRDTR